MPHPVPHPDSPPANYPRHMERTGRLDDGAEVYLRPIVPDDASVLAEEMELADSETLYLRFFTPRVKPDDAMLDTLTVLDYESRLAMAMLSVDGRSIGVGRYAEVDEETVEVAVVVKPAWRRHGAAAMLLDDVESAASARGYRSAVAYYLAENTGAERLLAARGYELVGIDGGIVEVTKPLDGAKHESERR